MQLVWNITRLVCIASLATLVIAGCGGEASKSDSDGPSTKAMTSAEAADQVAQPDAELQVVVAQVGGKDDPGDGLPKLLACDKSIPATCRGTITCPTADDAPIELRDVCIWLSGAEARTALTPEDPDAEPRACTMIYGGPQTASVTGTLDGEKIDVSFSREDGCQLARFDAAAPLWNGVGANPGEEPTAPPSATSSCPVITSPDTPVSSDDAATATPPSAADEDCATPPVEPDQVVDPPEAFE